ncbi:amino acid adenylation domain-containing protein [Streptomyces sp. TBY4]|uniref:amino acid adenylation domain-containing protein n=1 Tax=Streptomyces sp. TBY4 TaxID=2962030 RepID=UPI0020B67165|nr:amino acid adenylation domain-containing protein [Streptomyces sp. TBY4]MCP3757022.1 amino acid adenylation domain-containing protein [Streptomyces sp. TBY4]
MEPGEHTLITLFEEVVNRFPHRVAITAGDQELRYRELDRRANAVARRLRESGVTGEAPVALLLPRGAELAIGLIGVLKAGAAYVPLDPDHPGDRIAWTLKDTGASHVVTVPGFADLLAGSEVLPVPVGEDAEAAVSSPPAGPPRTEDLAYVIHTSGSTGLPKGVEVEHRHVVRLFGATHPWFGFDEHDVWALSHSIAFDFSVWEFWGALLFGGRLVVVPRSVARSPRGLHELLRVQGVTVLNQTASAFARLAAADEEAERPLTALRVVVFGGERLDVGRLRGWIARHGDARPRLVNMYGITEATVHASHRPITTADLDSPGVSPIGVPLPDLVFHVLDEDGRPVAGGVAGELYLSGAGVARGYLGRPELTKERFIELEDPTGGVCRAYRTGDRVRALPDGDHVYLGRTDDQMKIRGHRVEPGEVEAVLLRDPEVSAAVVLAHGYGGDDVRLIAHVVSAADPSVLAPRLGGLAAGLLPEHMRPSAYLVRSGLPLTSNGKVDKARLPAPTVERASAPVASPVGAPAALTDAERRIARIWQAVLEVPRVGRDTDFFDLGGTSLSLLRMFERVNSEFGTDLDVTVLIEAATVAELAQRVEAARAATPPAR